MKLKKGKVKINSATADVKELEGILHKPGRKVVSIVKMKQAVKKRFRKRGLLC